MAPLKIFLVGATGFIGGEILWQIVNQPELADFPIKVLVRSEIKGDKLKELTDNRINYVVGELTSTDLLKKQFEEADIVITAANVDDTHSASVLADVAKNKKKPLYILHTSGTSVLGDELAPSKDKKFDGKPYSDLKDNKKIISLPHDQPHRPVDEIILGIEESNPEYVKTVIIAPPAIYGFNHGYLKRISVQIPELIKLSISNKQAFTVYDGDYIWSNVHVRDLGKLYTLLLTKLLAKDSNVRTGKKGYYFVENGSHSWKDVSAKIEKTLFTRETVRKKGVVELEPQDVANLAGFEFAPYLWGTNSYSKADLARELGWKPKYGVDQFFQDIIDVADYLLVDGNPIPY